MTLNPVFSPRTSLVTIQLAIYISSHPELSYRQIGEKFGVTRQRVGAIARRYRIRRK